jgi:hypothetical protein
MRLYSSHHSDESNYYYQTMHCLKHMQTTVLFPLCNVHSMNFNSKPHTTYSI